MWQVGCAAGSPCRIECAFYLSCSKFGVICTFDVARSMRFVVLSLHVVSQVCLLCVNVGLVCSWFVAGKANLFVTSHFRSELLLSCRWLGVSSICCAARF